MQDNHIHLSTKYSVFFSECINNQTKHYGKINKLLEVIQKGNKETGKVYVNEINTIPGALSYYLWEATGKSFEKEIDELVQIALRRDRDKNKLTFSYDQNIFALSGGAKGGTKGSKVSKK